MLRSFIGVFIFLLLHTSISASAQGQPPALAVTGTLSLGTQEEPFNASILQGREAMIQRLDPITEQGFRLVMNVVPGANEGSDYKLFLRVYKPQKSAWLLVGEPILFTMDGQKASISLNNPQSDLDLDFKLDILVERQSSDFPQETYSDRQVCSFDQLEYSAAFMSGCCSSQCTVGSGTMTCCGALSCCACGICCQAP